MLNDFVIGVWAQPAFSINGSNFIDLSKKWTDRNVTHIITGDFEPKWTGNTVDKYAKWLKDHSQLKWMAYARAGFEAYPNYDNFAGYVMPDEPDMETHIHGTIDQAISAYVASCKAIRDKIPNFPILGNFAGSVFTASRTSPTPTQPLTQTHYAKFFSGLDTTSCDWYLTNTGRNVSKYLKATLGEQITRMTTLSNGKPAFSCIEASNQNLNAQSREPSNSEFAAMIMISLIRGAKGIWYFPQKIGGFMYDNISPTLSSFMTMLNKAILDHKDFFINGIRVATSTPGYESATWTLGNQKLTITLNCSTLAYVMNVNSSPPSQPPVISVDKGIKATYFSDTNLSIKVLEQNESQINLTSVPNGINSQEFSVRWEGFLVVPTSGDYTIFTQTDDGVRLFIDNKKLIDKWDRFRGENSINISLHAGKQYPIKMEYFQKWGSFFAKLLWQGPSIKKDLIPPNCLVSTSNGA